MRFSQAMANFENGAMVARHRWNKDINDGDVNSVSFVMLEKAYTTSLPQVMEESGFFKVKELTMLNHPCRKNRGDKISIWTPTIEDMMSRDWYVVDFNSKNWEQICGVPPSRRANNSSVSNDDTTE